MAVAPSTRCVGCWQPPGRLRIGVTADGVGRWRALGYQRIDLSVDRCQQPLRDHARQDQIAVAAELPQLLLAEHPSDGTAATPPSAPEFPPADHADPQTGCAGKTAAPTPRRPMINLR
jgi:hypothetical protein